ncbi:aldehyde dehydrogenase family protein [Streptomyces sp. SID10853]|uniref:aldehyde dehydrogenase family protein n=1 Tax=Streptomyces sp. SID10853 TaxID=2706028 RepID=UPI0013C293A0|nr:aldehyde dehydrogenase family protein [Streptomyces sp. SID10853]NDZ77250.1 aldehyde dehydrogenase family protein [Streptomyces sp. SID10853]
MTTVVSTDARTGAVTRLEVTETGVGEVASLTAAAARALPWLAEQGRTGRAALLDAIADGLEADAERITAAADRESGLGLPRLTGELARTAYQLRFLGDVVRDGGYLDAVIDRPVAETPAGPRPDLRRMLVPLGPVAVFGASNFPLAFGVAGGDTASALAVGAPVVAKAHPAHPETCRLVGAVIAAAVRERGGPAGVFSLVFGRDEGTALVTDPRITAVGFTGSLRGGRALYDLACARETPVPFYGELGGVNPLVVTAAAAAERGPEIGGGLAGSVLLGQGQFCTKPGLILLPAGADGTEAVTALAAAVRAARPGHLLTASIAAAFARETKGIGELPGVTVLAATEGADGTTGALVVEADPEALLSGGSEALLAEHFGPFAVVVRYADQAQLAAVLAAVPAALTGTVHGATEATDPDFAAAFRMLAARSGRVVVNGYPTGVAVSWAMHHGGGYPATTAPGETSVGAASVRRWLRPVTFQDAPQALLPAELADGPVPGLPRRIDGVLTIDGC